MRTPALRIVPAGGRPEGAMTRWSASIERVGGSDSSVRTLWFEIPEGIAWEPDDLEPFLIAMLPDALLEGRRVEVAGRVSALLLSNLHEFASAWNRWKPAFPAFEGIEALRIDASPPSWNGRAVAAFSGGLDAACTVFRHARKEVGHRSLDIAACALVHGFDIGLDNREKFDEALRLATETLASLGLDAVPVRTNYREIATAHWLDAHGAALVAALHMLKSVAPAGLLGSSKPYDDLVLPYGSNPITDPLLSAAGFAIVHDGSEFDRTGKAAVVSRWPEGLANLRVCWSGNQVEANCGKCEKCTRTKMNFLANRVAPPSSLGPELDLEDIRGLRILNRAVMVEFEQIASTARRNGVDAPWVSALERRIARLKAEIRIRDALRPWKRRLLGAFR